MTELVVVCGLALLPALGNFLGGLLAEVAPTSKRTLNRALHAAAGIVIAIVAVELMPQALRVVSGWLVGVTFGLGGAAYVALTALIERLQRQRPGRSGRTGVWMLYLAIAVDLFGDGLVIGAGAAVATSLALVVALGQVLADVPEGFATVASFKNAGLPRRRRLMLAASFAIPALLAAALAHVALRDQGDVVKMAALVATAGLLTVAAVEDMIAEAHATAPDTRASVIAFIGGFVLFTLLSAGLAG